MENKLNLFKCLLELKNSDDVHKLINSFVLCTNKISIIDETTWPPKVIKNLTKTKDIFLETINKNKNCIIEFNYCFGKILIVINVRSISKRINQIANNQLNFSEIDDIINMYVSKRNVNNLTNYVRRTLPESWEHVASEMKIKSELVQRICDTVPHLFRNKYHYKESLSYIKNRLYSTKGLLINILDMTNADLKKWEEFSYRVKDYEESCR